VTFQNPSWGRTSLSVVKGLPHAPPLGHGRHVHALRSFGGELWRYSSPVVHVPQGGGSQDVFNVLGSRPGAHVLHCNCPRVSWYCPSGQFVHWSSAAVRNLPIAHCWQAWFPVPVASSPSGQSSHPVAPGFIDWVLTKHALHVAEPNWSW
jgi:hypothetical protein